MKFLQGFREKFGEWWEFVKATYCYYRDWAYNKMQGKDK